MWEKKSLNYNNHSTWDNNDRHSKNHKQIIPTIVHATALALFLVQRTNPGTAAHSPPVPDIFGKIHVEGERVARCWEASEGVV